MVVIIPTFKRLDSLYWVIISLLNCELPDLYEKPRLVIVNNFPPNFDQINLLLERIRQEHYRVKFWEISLKNRRETLPPIKNWYSAIEEFSRKNEIVFLSGDDDLFCKNDIKERFEFIHNQAADILITKFHGGLTFINQDKVQIDGFPSLLEKKNAKLKLNNCKYYTSPFISAQVLCKNDIYQNALILCNKWIDEQHWAPKDQTALMLPYYLPIAIKYIGGKVIYSEKSFILRGTSLYDRIHSPFGVPGWNSGFVSIFTLDILKNNDLEPIRELDDHRKQTNNFINSWYFTFFFDKRINKELLKQTFSKVQIESNILIRLKSLKLVIANFFGINSIRIRIKSALHLNVYKLNKFLNEI